MEMFWFVVGVLFFLHHVKESFVTSAAFIEHNRPVYGWIWVCHLVMMVAWGAISNVYLRELMH